MKLKNLARPLSIRRISGDSMLPTLRDGQFVLASSILKPKVGKVIVIKHNDLEKIKRLKMLDKSTFYVVGDNSSRSTDSREFGKLLDSAYIGTVLYPFGIKND